MSKPTIITTGFCRPHAFIAGDNLVVSIRKTWWSKLAMFFGFKPKPQSFTITRVTENSFEIEKRQELL